jgi:hypothetical protein
VRRGVTGSRFSLSEGPRRALARGRTLVRDEPTLLRVEALDPETWEWERWQPVPRLPGDIHDAGAARRNGRGDLLLVGVGA